MRVESAGPTEMLLHPGNRLVAYGQRLLHDHPDKGAERPGDENKEIKSVSTAASDLRPPSNRVTHR